MVWGMSVSKTDLARDVEVASRLEDPFVRRSLKTALHMRRYLPFYVFGTIWLLTLSLFPSLRGGGDDEDFLAGNLPAGGETVSSEGATVGGEATGPIDAGAANATSATPGGGGAVAGAASGAGASRAAGATSNAAAAPAGAPKTVQESIAFAFKQGPMRDGRNCDGKIRQINFARYGAMCTAKYEGSNGGATYLGVTADKVRIVRREFPDSANSQAVAAFGAQAGLADEATTKRVRDEFISKFETIFELYGRKVEWIDYESQNGDSTQEALGQGREEACADATYIKETLKAFAVAGSSGVFGECAAQRGMMVFSTGAYFPESWFKKFHPYLWGGVMECERITFQVAEYTGKRLFPHKTKWAGDATLNGRDRKIGIYVPDNDEYQHCVKGYNEKLDANYGGKSRPREQYNYQLDVSRFPDQAAQGMLQFKAAQVTTVMLSCDPISSVALMAAATNQAYFPEWLNIGVAGNDTDLIGRLMEPTQAAHLFGMSQLGSTDKLIGPKSESAVVYRDLFKKEIPEGTTGDYYGVLGVYSMLQGAGPIVHPQTIAEGMWAQPPAGAPDYPVGYVSYRDGSDGTPGAKDHTGMDDSREIWWCGDCTAPDGDRGTFIETYSGRRFRNNEWPAEEPKVFVR
jgi:hypothetical protein